jgi:hypothetical protein
MAMSKEKTTSAESNKANPATQVEVTKKERAGVKIKTSVRAGPIVYSG